MPQHNDYEDIYEEIKVDPDKIEILQHPVGIKALQYLLETHQSDDRQDETVHKELIEFPSLYLLIEIDKDRKTEKVIREQENIGYERIYERTCCDPGIDKGKDIGDHPHEYTQRQYERRQPEIPQPLKAAQDHHPAESGCQR
jgi:hypothetical protein